MDPSSHYSDPLGEALSHSSQRAAQLVSLAVATAQVGARRKALRDARKAERNELTRRALEAEERALFARARSGWAPAHDPRWLAQADLLQTGQAWGAAAAFADADPVAASAMRKSEERLRALHPYAMARYDRLRDEGVSPLDAMRDAAPLFTREPHARPGQPGTRLQLGTAPANPDADLTVGVTDTTPGAPLPDRDLDWETERRGQEIAWRLQDHARVERGSELDPAELATALEATTNLPAEVIARLSRARSEERVADDAERARAAGLGLAAGDYSPGARAQDLRAARDESDIAAIAGANAAADRNAARLAAESFPCTAAHGIRAALNGSIQQTARPPVQVAAQNARGHGLST